MEIIGYSERGAMNALFYGIAIKDDKDAMIEFMKLLGYESDTYSDFKFYMEFSLSEYGSPDLLITAYDNNKKQRVVFFVEAKASCGKDYKLSLQQSYHDEYIVSKGDKRSNGHASNLFFQLRLKHLFFEKICKGRNVNADKLLSVVNGKDRSIGNNDVVLKIVNEVIKRCADAVYIAITPDEDEDINDTQKYGFDIKYVSWKKILEKSRLKQYLKETIEFNEGKEGRSQILNKYK